MCVKTCSIGREISEALGELKTQKSAKADTLLFVQPLKSGHYQQCFHLAKDLRTPASVLLVVTELQEKTVNGELYRSDCEEYSF